jgi:hypothetical protein
MNKKQRIDEIVSDHQRLGAQIFHNPSYAIPEGFPRIDLEVQTPDTRMLFIVMDLARAQDPYRDVSRGIYALQYVQHHIISRGEHREIGTLLDCLNSPFPTSDWRALIQGPRFVRSYEALIAERG